MTLRVEVGSEMLDWAVSRSRLDPDVLATRFPKLADWLAGATKPTLKQLESFATATHTPLGYLFLPSPPVEALPIPDLRTMKNVRVERPSADMLDTIYLCQQRQEWYQEFARITGEGPREFVGSVRLGADVVLTAATMRAALGFDLKGRAAMKTWQQALRKFIEHADRLGVMVMVNGVVGSNTHRKLDPQEFRGFALVNPLAPLVFINGADTKAAQMFTLAHELAHVWLGTSALSNASPEMTPTQDIEQWCNQVAAELLVPLTALRAQYRRQAPLASEVSRLAGRFKVSTLVILRRIQDAGGLSKRELSAAYQAELSRLIALNDAKKAKDDGGGGDFYKSLPLRTSERFARAVIGSMLEGQTLYRDALRLLGVRKIETFFQVER